MEIKFYINNPFRHWRCWFKHRWKVYQHNLMADESALTDRPIRFVIAFKVCKRCAHSELIHLLE